jgi:transcription elongation factor Elf1
MKIAYTCPICGYDQLTEPPYDKNGNPSYEICSCCGFEYGYDDHDQGESFESYRIEWINNGAIWFDQNSKPKDWSLKSQLLNINIKLPR